LESTSTDLGKHFPKSVEVLYPQTRGVHVCTGAATHCTTLQHTATHCNPLQHTVTQCNTPQHTATRSDNLNAQVLEPRTQQWEQVEMPPTTAAASIHSLQRLAAAYAVY